jgi:transposase InsO family protein
VQVADADAEKRDRIGTEVDQGIGPDLCRDDIAGDLADWLDERAMRHTRGAPYHLQTQGKIERWHQTLKNRILLETYYLPSDLTTAGCPRVLPLRQSRKSIFTLGLMENVAGLP